MQAAAVAALVHNASAAGALDDQVIIQVLMSSASPTSCYSSHEPPSAEASISSRPTASAATLSIQWT